MTGSKYTVPREMKIKFSGAVRHNLVQICEKLDLPPVEVLRNALAIYEMLIVAFELDKKKPGALTPGSTKDGTSKT